MAKNEQLDGIHSPDIKFFNVAQGWALLRDGTAGGKEGAILEICEALPIVVMYQFWELFKDRFRELSSPDPPTWKFIDFDGLPKISWFQISLNSGG